MGKIYMRACMKGGCAKTVTTYNLAYSLKELGKKVLCVDFDSQANLSTCFGVENPAAVPVTIGHLMMAQIDDDELPGFKEYIQSRNGVDFISSSMMLSAVDAKLRLEMGAEKMLSEILEPLRDRYDARPLMGRMLKEEENLTGKVKGKIVIEKNIRSNTMHGRNDRFYCQYLRFSDDIIENQILKAALRKAKRFIVDYFGDYSKDNNNYASMISYCSNALRHISDIQCSGTACNGLKFSGCYTYYKPVMAMARMVLDDISVESNGEISTTGYIVPYAISMEKLFEVYVRAYLKKNGIESYRSKSDKGIRLEKYDNKTDVFMEEEGLSNPGKYISGSIKPDLILTDRESGETVVFDVKYKDYTNGDSRNDRLQLLAYSMMMNANNVGIILPTHVDVEIFDARRINSMENRIVKYHQMLLGIMKDNPTIADYIKDNTFEKKE